ncbi:MAG: 2-oxo-4-hydroxy-4-carboxy-5-ureidoimidazoline decarboxylase [Pyrinomonadaceae bacterium]|nr:2-oxo-4-hydroxy-4-carboxy-5-ureidoimidazoline decarboxylase [Pyrinomonadaceae bacterium]
MQSNKIDLERINSLDEEAFREELHRCCGSRRWVELMAARRSFTDGAALSKAAEEIWFGLSREDWLEAFSHHPKIGDVENLREKFSNTLQWAKNEQSAVEVASEETIKALAEANQAYENRFGYIFIVCATGKSADEMLAILQHRLRNEPSEELQIAAREQHKITNLRLMKL